MPLFQQSVLKKYINDLDKDKLAAAWTMFRVHFHDLSKQQNIRNAKEEQYQEGFLRELFVDVLDYTLNPQPAYNLTTEYKNEKDSKKTDGAILKDGAVRAVIELKGTDTTDLAKVETQAFSYLHNQKGCTYVITSNFEKLRFYIGDAIEHEEFNLFTLNKERFTLLYLCLQKDNLLADLPLSIKQQSLAQEDAITKKLYSDYSSFKKLLFQNLAEKNGQYNKLELFKKTQKLLDRFLFILFAEDRLLLPPNFIIKIVDDWKSLQKMRIQQSLYDRFKMYFNDLLEGNKNEDIFAYNGGLFEKDEVLDNIIVDDDILVAGVLKLSNYDYNTEVDVNILGHIFEHSLNEIEQLQNSLTNNGEGEDPQQNNNTQNTKETTNPQPTTNNTESTPGGPCAPVASSFGGSRKGVPSRRKKEGVFYTPRYITKYIVDNTVGALCNEKKAALEIFEEDYAPAVKKTKASEAQRKALVQKLDDYRSWLLGLTICDPACGSGAFLNAALEFLITEHSYIDELTNKLMGASLSFKWTPNDILEHNLFGVDINEEAVEIARLSLWLRTAQKGRKLSNLSNNIKCGNSLIDDPEVAGAKAFNWKEEFKTVFDDGGFDVVIGNPPYVRQEKLGPTQKEYFQKRYQLVFNGIADLYVYFYQLGIEIIKLNGKLGFITPNKWMEKKYGYELRDFLRAYEIEMIVDYGELKIFSDASTEPMIICITKTVSNSDVLYTCIKELKEAKAIDTYSFQSFQKQNLNPIIWRFNEKLDEVILKKFSTDAIKLNEFRNCKLYRGITTGLNKAIIINQATYNEIVADEPKAREIIKPEVEGEDLEAWNLNFAGRYMIVSHYDLDLPTLYPVVYRYLSRFKEELESRMDKGKNWYNLRRCDYYSQFETAKIIFYHTALKHNFYLDQEGYFISNNCYFISNANPYLQCLLNSSLFNYVRKLIFPTFGDARNGGRIRLDANKMINLPIKKPGETESIFEKLALEMKKKHEQLNIVKRSFLKLLQAKHESLTISKKLANWPSLFFKEFLKELEKQKIKLSLQEQTEWLTYFEAEKNKAAEIQNIIDATDKEIDAMVYKLYDLTEEEISIVESN